MDISFNIIHNLNEKASIDWNNYLTKEEVIKFLSKDDKVEAAEDIIYSNEFKPRYKNFHNDLQNKYNNSWSKDELVQDLANFYYHGHLNESIDELWKSQISQKDDKQLQEYLNKLYRQLANYNKDNSDIKSTGFSDILNKIDFIENKLGVRPHIGRQLH